jgi:tetratricopeptide (TPR) repeat protein
VGRPDEALAYFREARAAWQKVVDDNPARYAEPIELGSTYNRIGWALFGRGRMTEAVEEYRAAEAIFRGIVARFPPKVTPRTRSELSNVLINIAEIERRRGRLPEARALCDEALAIRKAVIAEFPEVTGYRWRMGECLLRSGQVRLATGDPSGAASVWREAIRAYEIPTRGGELAMFEAGCHDLLSGLVGATGSGVPASEAGPEAEAAMVILRRIAAEGYDASQIRMESSLDTLRDRPDFRLLLMDLTMPAEPFATAR